MNSTDFLETLIKAIVEYPQNVNVVRTTDDMGVLLSVSVDPQDMGKVIGKGGQTAKTIRYIMSLIGFKTREKVSIKFLEPAN